MASRKWLQQGYDLVLNQYNGNLRRFLSIEGRKGLRHIKRGAKFYHVSPVTDLSIEKICFDKPYNALLIPGFPVSFHQPEGLVPNSHLVYEVGVHPGLALQVSANLVSSLDDFFSDFDVEFDKDSFWKSIGSGVALRKLGRRLESYDKKELSVDMVLYNDHLAVIRNEHLVKYIKEIA